MKKNFKFLKNKKILVPISLTGLLLIGIIIFFITNNANKNKTQEKIKLEETQSEDKNSNIRLAKEEEDELQLKELTENARLHINSSNEPWALILVNSAHPLAQSYDVETVEIDGVPVDIRIKNYVNNLLNEANNLGVKLGLCSGYRSVETQRELFNNEVVKHVDIGHSQEKAENLARQNVARPGESEHNTGLAIDCYSYSNRSANLEEEFAQTEEGMFIREHCQDFGFIIRYEQNKTDITGVNYEPWHLRYVGVQIAKEIKNSGLSFEEYYEKYIN